MKRSSQNYTFSNIKARIFPPGSKRESIWIEIKQAARLFRRDGVKGIIQYVTLRSKLSRLTIPAWWLSDSIKTEQQNWAAFLAGLNQLQLDGVAFIIAATPYDISEGQRSTWITRALLRAGWGVIYAYWRWSPNEGGGRIGEGGRLLEISLDIAWSQASRLFNAYELKNHTRLFLAEFPHPCLFSMINLANVTGWNTWYDRIDDWAEFHKVGQADWFDPDFEQYLSRNVMKLSATTEPLVTTLMEISNKPVQIIPNAYEPQIFPPGQIPRPIKEPVTIGYFGQLTPAWFDWDLLFFLADKHPDWNFELIGPGSLPFSSRNNIINFGKVPHDELPNRAVHWNAALVPFRSSILSKSVDPIKIYEYLALGLPVVVSGIPHLSKMPYVFVADEYVDFDKKLVTAVNTPINPDIIRDFLVNNNWDQRVSVFLNTVKSSNYTYSVITPVSNHQGI